MKKKQKEYTLEFKKEAVRLVTEQGYSVTEAAANLGISAKNLYNWRSQLNKVNKEPRIKRTDEQIEINRLKKENAQLKLEREILKKAAAFFANELN